MTFRSPDNVQLEEIAGRLVESLGECDENALPSVDGVISFARDVREVLFPGYGRTRRLPQAEQQMIETSSLLNQIESRLRIETGRAILHARHTHLKLHSDNTPSPKIHGDASSLAKQFLTALPELQLALRADIKAAFDGDPAARTNDEIILCYPGIAAVLIYRVAHKLQQLGIPYLPRILTEWAHCETGIDIHPGAKIGPRFFIDHGTGVVIGETCEIGAGVTLYQGVTLGAWSFPRDEDGNLIRGEKRHPTLEDDVTVYSSATILGGTTVIGAGSLVGSNVVLSRSVMPNTIVTIEKPSLRFREAG